MKTVYFVRHGETEGNTGNFFQDTTTPLSREGLRQATLVAERCKNLAFDALISSTMTRALQTAHEIKKMTDHTIEQSGFFTERLRPDELSGKSKSDPSVEVLHEKWRKSIFSDGPRVSNGENFQDLQNRAQDALQLLLAHDAERILVVTHGFFLRFLIAEVIYGNGLDGEKLAAVLKSFRMNNTGITMLQYGKHADNDSDYPDEHWIVRVWNDHAHLG